MNILKPLLDGDATVSAVKYVIFIAIFVAGILAPIYSIKQDIALIKQHNNAYMERMTFQIEQNSDEIKALREQQSGMLEAIAENRTMINIYHK